MPVFTSSERGDIAPSTPPTLRSRVPGRERWAVPSLTGNLPAALSLKTLLESEMGISHVEANQCTGRVLVEYSPAALQQPIEALLTQAIAFGPLLPHEVPASPSFANNSSRSSAAGLSLHCLISAELGCLLLKLLAFALACPACAAGGVVAIGLVGFSSGWGRTQPIGKAVGGCIAGGIEPNEPCRIADDQNCAEIM